MNAQSPTDCYERGILNLKNCRLMRHNFKDKEDKYAYGFQLLAKGKILSFYLRMESEREKWLEKLTHSVISLELFEEFWV